MKKVKLFLVFLIMLMSVGLSSQDYDLRYRIIYSMNESLSQSGYDAIVTGDGGVMIVTVGMGYFVDSSVFDIKQSRMLLSNKNVLNETASSMWNEMSSVENILVDAGLYYGRLIVEDSNKSYVSDDYSFITNTFSYDNMAPGQPKRDDVKSFILSSTNDDEYDINVVGVGDILVVTIDIDYFEDYVETQSNDIAKFFSDKKNLNSISSTMWDSISNRFTNIGFNYGVLYIRNGNTIYKSDLYELSKDK